MTQVGTHERVGFGRTTGGVNLPILVDASGQIIISPSSIIDTLTSKTNTSTLVLTSDGTDQTLTGDTGQLNIVPSAGLVLNTNLVQGDKISAFEFRDLEGNGAGADRNLGFYFRMLNREGLGAFDPDEAVMSLTAQANPTLILYATGVGGGTEAGYMDKGGFGFATSVDADGLPDKSSSGPRLKFASSGTQNLLTSSTLVTKFLIAGGRATGSTIVLSLSGNNIQDQQIIFQVGSGGLENAATTKPFFLFTTPHPFNASSTQNYLEMEWDDSGAVLRTRLAIDRDNSIGFADQSDLGFLVFTKYLSSTTITANRTITIDVVNSDRTLKISGNATISQDYSVTGSPQFASPLVNTLILIDGVTGDQGTIKLTNNSLTTDHVLDLDFGDADRTITLSGNPTLSDWFDQSVKTTANVTFGDVEINGSLNHDGSSVGFFGNVPSLQASAYTQTYTASTKTVSNLTSFPLNITSTNSSPWGFSSQAQADSIQTEVNALRIDLRNVKDVLNAVIDDLQVYGLMQ